MQFALLLVKPSKSSSAEAQVSQTYPFARKRRANEVRKLGLSSITATIHLVIKSSNNMRSLVERVPYERETIPVWAGLYHSAKELETLP